jgi:putative transposase
MAKTDRLTGSTGWIDLEFVERERTPRELIEKGTRHHLASLSLSNTVILLEESGVERSRVAIHNWVQKAQLQPAGGKSPDRVAVDQKAIRVNDQLYWLYAVVDPATNRILHSRLFPTSTIARAFLTEVDDLIGALRQEGYSYRVQRLQKRCRTCLSRGRTTNVFVLKLF